MLGNTNWWNKCRYTIYQPIYDLIAGVFAAQRKKSIAQIQRQDEALHCLIDGAGTGLDLPYIPKNWKVTAIDLTPVMVSQLKRRAKKLDRKVEAYVMDAHQLGFPDESFDVVVLHLILAVIPDPYKCIKEVERVLKPGGEVIVMDKFIKEGQRPSLLRKMVNIFTALLFSEINRDIDEILSHSTLQKITDEPIRFKGAFRLIRIQK